MTKESKKNVIIMCIIGLMFIVGIILRWDYISKEAKFGVERYTNAFEDAQKEKDADKEADK